MQVEELCAGMVGIASVWEKPWEQLVYYPTSPDIDIPLRLLTSTATSALSTRGLHPSIHHPRGSLKLNLGGYFIVGTSKIMEALCEDHFCSCLRLR
jgi:hypothetical protein